LSSPNGRRSIGNASGLVLLGEMHFQAGEVEAAKLNWTRASQLHPTGEPGHPAQPSDHASAQQGADLLKLIDYRGRKREPGKFAFVQMPHIHQGYNHCGATACASFARFQGSDIGGWGFKKLCPSPLGTGTDWWHLLDASAEIGQKWKLVTYPPDDAGFDEGAAMLKRELDAGRPVVVDFKYIGPQYSGGFAGHTLSVCGYIAAENLYILCNPAVATPRTPAHHRRGSQGLLAIRLLQNCVARARAISRAIGVSLCPFGAAGFRGVAVADGAGQTLTSSAAGRR